MSTEFLEKSDGNETWQKAAKEGFPPFNPQRAMELAGVTESRGDEKKFENDLQKIDSEKALKFLIFLNGALTKTKKSERLTSGSGVWGGSEVSGHLSPNDDTKEIAIEETLDAIKNDIKDNHKRAVLAYYMINHLHLFGDGNGRTARATYEIFDKKDFNITDRNFIHETKNDEEIGNREEFEKNNNLKPVAEASNLALDFVKKDLVKDARLSSAFLSPDVGLDLPNGKRPMPNVYLTDDAKKNLSYVEKNNVRYAFFEKPVATTALGMMLRKKHTERLAIARSTKMYPNGNKRVLFKIENKDENVAKENFDGWSANDYRDYCNTVQDLQLKQARKLIDIFKNEDKYKMADGRTCADWLSK